MKNRILRAVVAVALLLTTNSCAWWQRHGGQINCAAITTIENIPQLRAIVAACTEVATTPAAILPCVAGAAGSKWANDTLACFMGSEAGLARCLAAEKLTSATLDTDKRTRLREALRDADYQFAQ